MSEVKEIKIDEMTQLRELTRQVSAFLLQEVTTYVKTLTPLFSPRKVLGEYMAGTNNAKVLGAEKNFAIIEEQYNQIMLEGFGFGAKLSSVVPTVTSKLSLHNWVYQVECKDSLLDIVCPLKWVLGYENTMTIKTLHEFKREDRKLSQEDASEYVIRNLVFARLLDIEPGLVSLLHGLGYSVTRETIPELSGNLPYVVVSAPVASFRPQEELVGMATQFSGSTSFEELVDKTSIESVPNKFHEKIARLI